MKTAALSLFLLVFAGGLHAQPAMLGGPSAGMLFDPCSRSLYPIVGVPGSAYLGAPLETGLEWAAVAPDGETALAVREGRLYLLRGRTLRLIDGLAGDRIVFNSDSSAAAVFSSSARRVQVIRLQDPAAPPDIRDLSWLEGPVSLASMDAAARTLVIGVEGAIHLIAEDGTLTRLLDLRSPSAAVIAGEDLYVADQSLNRVFHIPGYASGAGALHFAEVPEPVGLAIAGRSLLVASRAERSVEVFDALTGAWQRRLSADEAPGGIESVSPSSLLLRAGCRPAAPFYLLGAGDTPAIHFVPFQEER